MVSYQAISIFWRKIMTKKLNELKTELTPTMTLEELRSLVDPVDREKIRKMTTGEIRKFFKNSLERMDTTLAWMKERNKDANQ
jgi:hypothetical protein